MMDGVDPEGMRQYGPFPTELADLVANLRYRPGWQFRLDDIERDRASTHGAAAGGLTFIGLTGTVDGPAAGGEGGWSYDDSGNLLSYEGAMDAYRPEVPRPVYFYFPVPAATFNRASWQRWLFDRLMDVERHEAMEHFQVGDERPFSPTHAPGWDPYIVHEYAPEVVRRTSFRGEVSE